MSTASAQKFREYLASNPALQQEIMKDLADSRAAPLTLLQFLSAKGLAHGFNFSEEDARIVVDAAANDELTDFELELVSGGGREQQWSSNDPFSK